MIRPRPDRGDWALFQTLQCFEGANSRGEVLSEGAIQVWDYVLDQLMGRARELAMSFAEYCELIRQEPEQARQEVSQRLGALGELWLDEFSYRRLIRVLRETGAVIEGRPDLHGQLAFSDVEFISACRNGQEWQVIGLLTDLTCELAGIQFPVDLVVEQGFQLRVFGPAARNLQLTRDQLRGWAGLPPLEEQLS